ncbi:hypothetical protein AC1031_009249 [Aphanomyces cochlioides]|nr:hypothetical protein AC1031_009249 [Aphanomyces cochlioides]
MSVQEAAPAEKSQPKAQAEAGPPAVQEMDPGSAEETKEEDAVATEAPAATSQASERSRSPNWGPLPATMTSVQRELFQRLANDVPQNTKQPKDLTYDEYAIIHHKVVLYEAAKAHYQIPDKPHPPGIRYMDTEWMERNEEYDDPFLVDDDELHAAKKKVGQMENKMLGIKKVKITKAQRKKMEEETIAENERRERESRNGANADTISSAIKLTHSARKKSKMHGQKACRRPTIPPLVVDGDILLTEDKTDLLDVSDPRDVNYPQDVSDPRDEKDLHDMADLQDTKDPQDATAGCRDDDLHHDQPSGGGIKFLSSHIKAPEIESFDRDHLVAWLKKRIKYEKAILLEVLCKIKLKIDVRDLTEDRFQQYIWNIVKTRPPMKRATECEIKKALSDVLMKTKGDVNSRLLDFMDQLYTAIQDNCLQRSMEDKDVRKVRSTLSDLIEEQMEIHRSAEELVEKHAMTSLKREREDSFSSSSPSPEPKTKFRRSHDRKDTESPEASHRSRQGDLHANTHHNQRMTKYGPTSGKDDKPKVKFDLKPSGVCYNCR